MVYIVLGAVFIFGTMLGSFLNVVLLRKNTGETIVHGRSRCFSCNKTIAWHDNLPIIGYIILGGRCRYCRSKISFQYLIVELLVGFLAILVFFNNTKHPMFGIIEFLFYFGAFASLFSVAAYDARTKIIDRHLLNIFAGFSLISAMIRWWYGAFSWQVVFYDVVSAVAIWFFFWSMYYFSNETWMGRGDGPVAWWSAIFLGYPLSIIMLFFSFWIGGIFGAILIIAHQIKVFRKNGSVMKLQIPFAPFLALGVFVAWYFADILKLFFQLFLW